MPSASFLPLVSLSKSYRSDILKLMIKLQILKWERAGQKTRKKKSTTRSTLPTNTSCFHTQIYTDTSTYASTCYSLRHSIVFTKSVLPAHIGAHTTPPHTRTLIHTYRLPLLSLSSSLPLSLLRYLSLWVNVAGNQNHFSSLISGRQKC